MKRPIKEQVNNGVRVGLGFGSFLIGAMLFIAGMDRLMWSAVPPHSISWSDPIGWAELILALAMLIPSAGIWWQLLAGFMLFAIVKGALVLITGTDLYTQSGSFPRTEAAELAVFATVSLLLMYRFSKYRPMIIDRIALTLNLSCLLGYVYAAHGSGFNPWLVAGLIALAGGSSFAGGWGLELGFEGGCPMFVPERANVGFLALVFDPLISVFSPQNQSQSSVFFFSNTMSSCSTPNPSDLSPVPA